MLGLVPPPIDATNANDLITLPDPDLHARYIECRRRERQAASEAARVLAEIDRRRSYAAEGFLSTTAFVAWRTGEAHQAAAGLVRVARTLADMPHTAAAFERGDIDLPRVRRLIDAHDTAPEAFDHDEATLVERACSPDARGFTATIALWRERMAPEATLDAERHQYERRSLRITDTFEGMSRLEALLDPVAAATIGGAIDTLAGPANRDGDDGRTPTQRRTDALTEICRFHLDHGDTPIRGGRRPHLNVTVDLDALTGEAPGRSEIGHRRVLGPAAREYLACDATVCGIVLTQPGEVLHMGRQSRTATPAQLRALAIRDGGCVIPGCDRPPEWCDAHHLLSWIYGGRTDIEQLVLVCRPHHYAIHLGILQYPEQHDPDPGGKAVTTGVAAPSHANRRLRRGADTAPRSARRDRRTRDGDP